MRPRFLLLSLALLVFQGAAFAKPPTLARFFPPGVQRGQQVEVKAEGSFDRWPVEAWVARVQGR